MPVAIDLHVHTTHSGTGEVTAAHLAEEVRKRNLTHVTVTDSGATEGVVELRDAAVVGVLPGLELSTEEGHFLLFCEDLRFLNSLGSYVRSIATLPRRDDLALVWAHPWAYTPDGARRAPAANEPLTGQVLPHVHGIEVFNGNMALALGGEMLSKSYVRDVIELARGAGKAMVGGSDAHYPERFFSCWTEIEVPPDSAQPGDLIQAIRGGRTLPRTSIPSLQPYASLV
jgi:predicted metal-dependent phosphoesterase TrpH